MAKGKGGSEFVLKSKIKDAISKKGLRSSSDIFEAVNGVVGWYVEEAVARAKANGRQTVRGYDFHAGK